MGYNININTIQFIIYLNTKVFWEIIFYLFLSIIYRLLYI